MGTVGQSIQIHIRRLGILFTDHGGDGFLNTHGDLDGFLFSLKKQVKQIGPGNQKPFYPQLMRLEGLPVQGVGFGSFKGYRLGREKLENFTRNQQVSIPRFMGIHSLKLVGRYCYQLRGAIVR